MISKIEINDFKNISKINIKFDDSNIIALVGSNHSGKSSILQAIHFLTSIFQSQKLFAPTAKWKNNQLSFTISPDQILYLPVNDILSIAKDANLKENNGPKISIETVNGMSCSAEIKKGKNKNLAIGLTGEKLSTQLQDIESPWSIYVPGIAGITKFESYVNPGALMRRIARGDANLVMRNILLLLKKKSKLKELNGYLNKIFQTEIHVNYQENEDEFIVVRVKKGTLELPFYSVGTGFLQCVQILGYILLYQPKIILLDEPDSHLHPDNQKLLIQILNEISLKYEIKILIATHSKNIIENIGHGNKISWVSNGGSQEEADHIKVLMELGALGQAESLLVKANKIKNLILTEDRDTKYLDLILQSSGVHPDHYMIWSYKGCSKSESATILSQFVRKISPKTKIRLYRDHDYITKLDLENDKCDSLIPFDEYEKHDIDMFYFDYVDIEGRFCEPKYLASTNKEDEVFFKSLRHKCIDELLDDLKLKAEKGREEVQRILRKNKQTAIGELECKKWADEIDFKSDSRWIHGKTLLGKIRNEYKSLTKKNLVISKSDELAYDLNFD